MMNEVFIKRFSHSFTTRIDCFRILFTIMLQVRSSCILLKINIVHDRPKLVAMQNRWLPWICYEYFLTQLNASEFSNVRRK